MHLFGKNAYRKDHQDVCIFKKLLDAPNGEQDTHCQKWSNKFNKAYNKWKNLSQQEKENDKWRKEILQIIRKHK